MAANSGIEWTDHTHNHWFGCSKVSPGCDHCYAERMMDLRLHKAKWGPGEPRVLTAEDNRHKPYAWHRSHDAFFAIHGRRQRVFCSSLADVFDLDVPLEWFVDLLDTIRKTTHLDWQLLTKRIGNVVKRLRAALDSIKADDERKELRDWLEDWLAYRPPANVWLGITVVNQEEADRDIPKLLATPARIRFLSMEPLLGLVDIEDYLVLEHPHCDGFVQSPRYEHGYCDKCAGHETDPIHTAPLGKVDWVIVGGESGPLARPVLPLWVESLRDQCARKGTQFFFKQWGEWHTRAVRIDSGEAVFRQFSNYTQWVNKAPTWVNGGICLDKHGKQLWIGADFARARDEHAFPVTVMHKVGKDTAGRLLDGRLHEDFPLAA